MGRIFNRIKTMTKRTVVGVTATGVIIAGGVGWRVMQMLGQAGEEGAVVNLDENNGMFLTDLRGRPAFMKYYDGQNKQDLQLTLNVITDSSYLPDSLLRDFDRYYSLGALPTKGPVTRENYFSIQPEVIPIFERFAQEFEELTGIHLNIVQNQAAGADITVAGFTDEKSAGFASFPLDIPNIDGLYSRRAFIMLDVGDLQRRLEQGDHAAIQSLIAHEFGHTQGLFHPHENVPVDTAMTLAQQEAVSAMSYNDVTFPPVAGTDVATNYGPIDIFLLREALRSQGVPLPQLNLGEDNYLLGSLMEWQIENTQSKRHSAISQVPALSILDNGGTNTLTGTDGDDLLVSESGYCGLIDRSNDTIELMKDGAPFCLVEGEFSVVRSGDGNDIILTASGVEQEVYLGTGNKDVALMSSHPGETTIHSAAREEEGETTLTMHYSVLERSEMQVRNEGDDIVLEFTAASGRVLGSFSLLGQNSGHGIDHLRVVDNEGKAVFEVDISDEMPLASWQQDVAQAANLKIEDYTMEHVRWEIDKARQAVAGSAGHWTETEDESKVNESHGYPDQPQKEQTRGSEGQGYAAYVRRREEEQQTQQQRNRT